MSELAIRIATEDGAASLAEFDKLWTGFILKNAEGLGLTELETLGRLRPLFAAIYASGFNFGVQCGGAAAVKILNEQRRRNA